jgi:hypothetical protein
MKLATALLATTAIIALAGCNRTAGNNSSTANTMATNAVAPAPATTNTLPADGNAMGNAAGGAKPPSDQPAGEEGMEGAEMNGQ